MYMYLDLSAIYQIKFKMDLIKLATDDRMEIIEQDTCTLTYSGNFESLASAFEGETSDQLVVTGEGIDAVFLTNRMRKKFSYATLLSVEEVKEEKDEGGQDGGEEEDETETNENYPPPCPMCGTYHSPMYHHVVYDPYPNSCSIL